MKQKIIIGILVAFLAQGCIVKSLHPFFTETDITFREELISTWIDQDGNTWKINRIKEKPNAYEMQWLEGGKVRVTFLAHLFRLNNQLYVDFLPISSDSGNGNGQMIFDLHLMPTHSIARVDELSPHTLKLKWFNEEWLATLFKQNRIRISHEVIMDEFPKDPEDRMYVLTASTEELQKFILKYGHEDQAFDNGNTVSLTLQNAN
jgi:hypothetical protein